MEEKAHRGKEAGMRMARRVSRRALAGNVSSEQRAVRRVVFNVELFVRGPGPYFLPGIPILNQPVKPVYGIGPHWPYFNACQ